MESLPARPGPPDPNVISQPPVPSPKPKFNFWIVSTIVLTLFLLLSIIYFLILNNKTLSQNQKAIPLSPTDTLPQPLQSPYPVSTKTYTNSVYGYSALIPQSWYVYTENEHSVNPMIGYKSSVGFWPEKEEPPGQTYRRGIWVEVFECETTECDSRDLYIQSVKDAYSPKNALDVEGTEAFQYITDHFNEVKKISKITLAGYLAVRFEDQPSHPLGQYRSVAILAKPYLFHIFTTIVDPNDLDFEAFDKFIESFTLK